MSTFIPYFAFTISEVRVHQSLTVWDYSKEFHILLPGWTPSSAAPSTSIWTIDLGSDSNSLLDLGLQPRPHGCYLNSITGPSTLAPPWFGCDVLNGCWHDEPYIRGAFNQECGSIHKIWINKVTEVSNSSQERYFCCRSIPVFWNQLSLKLNL